MRSIQKLVALSLSVRRQQFLLARMRSSFRILLSARDLQVEKQINDALIISQFFSGMSALMLYIQYMGVVLIQTVELGFFGNVFIVLRFLSALIDLEVSDDIVAFAIFALACYPLFIVFVIKRFLRGKARPLVFRETERKTLIFMSIIFSFLLATSPVLIVAKETGPSIVCMIFAGYLFVGLIIFAGRRGIIVKASLIQLLRGLLTLLYIPLAGFVAQVIALAIETAQDIRDFNISISDLEDLEVLERTNGVATGGIPLFALVLIYILFFEIQFSLILRNQEEEEFRCVCCIKWLCCATCLKYTDEEQAFIRDHIGMSIRSERWFFIIVFLAERTAMSLISGVLGTLEADEESGGFELAPLILFAIILSTSLLLTALFRPYKDRYINFIEMFPRASHLLLVLIIMLSPVISDGLLQVLLFSVAIPSLFLWYIFINPRKALSVILQHRDETVGTVNLAQARLRWHNLQDKGSMKTYLSKRNKKVTTKFEWEVLSNTQKVYLICAIEENDTHLLLTDSTYHFPSYYEEIVTNGLSAARNITVMDMRNICINDKLVEAVQEENMFDYFDHLNEVILSNNEGMSTSLLTNLLSQLVTCTHLKVLRIRESGLSASHGECIADFIRKTRLHVLDLSYNFLMQKGIEEILLAASEGGTITDLRLEDNVLGSLSHGTIELISKFDVVEEFMLCQNCLKADIVVPLLRAVSGTSIKTFGCSFQKSFEKFESLLDNEGNMLVSESQFSESLLSRESLKRTLTPRIVRNEMAKILEEVPYLKFNPLENSIRSCVSMEDSFESKGGVLVGFKKKVWLFLLKGICCYLSTAISVLSKPQKEQVSEFINTPDEDGRTVAELVLENGISHIPYTLSILVEVGLDLKVVLSHGSTLLDLIKRHEEEEVRLWYEELAL